VGAESAAADPARFVAVTSTRTKRPRRPDVTESVDEVAPRIASQSFAAPVADDSQTYA
jgi:hypothetical protein